MRMTPQDAVDRPVVTATVALILLLLGSVVAYANDDIAVYANGTGTADDFHADLHVPIAAVSVPTFTALPCRTITSWSDLTSAMDATAAAAAAAHSPANGENDEMEGHPSPPQPPVLLLCPFDIVHDGTNNDGYDIITPDLTVVCWKNVNGGSDDADACAITGTARHFNIAADNVNLAGIAIKGSRNGAVVLEDGVQGTTFVGVEFLDNTLESGDGGAISLRLGSSATLFTGCLFSDNFAVNGGAISGAFATATLHSSTMHFNEAAGNGGGVHMQGGQPYIFSVSHSHFLYNAASDGNGPALWSDGVPCDSGDNYACNNVDWTTNAPCDGIFEASGGTCKVFEDNCHAGVDADERSGGDSSNNEDVGADSTVGGDEYEDNISSDKTESPTATLSASPSVSTLPTHLPSASPSSGPSMRPSYFPSAIPTTNPTQTHSSEPSSSPTTSPPTLNPTQTHSGAPSSSPSSLPSSTPTVAPSEVPTEVHSDVPTSVPTVQPSHAPTTSFQPTPLPTTSPTLSPTTSPSATPSSSPSASPTTSSAPTRGCHANEVERAQQISDLIIENTETSFQDILNDSSPQHRAFHWLLYEDEVYICPEDDGIIQRYTVAVFYFSTSGDNWTQCGADETLSTCGEESGEVRFLSGAHECEWYGISCDGTKSITKIAFERNNLNGHLPEELSSLSNLVTLSLEKMSLRGTIPSSLGFLVNLLSLDLDFNDLTGTIPPELGKIHGLKLLDLNDNNLSGSIDALAGFHHLLFAQLHHNRFSGQISVSLGDLLELRAITLFGNDLTGSVPRSMCTNRVENGGTLQHLEVDCGGESPELVCDCCSQCWTESPTSHPTYSPSPLPSAHPTPVASAPPSISAAPTAKCNMDTVSRAVFLQSLLRDVSDPISMVTEGSAQNRAWTWLLEGDEMYTCPTDSNVVQRYVMAVFYYSTLGDSWFSCADNNNTPCPRGADTYRWLTGANECNWFGVDCDINGVVTGVVFDDNDLAGQIPAEISHLYGLEVLKLENGKIGGTIPSSLGDLTSLRELDLDFNLLTGSIPQELSNTIQLQVLDLNNNYDLTGNIHPLSQLINLQFLQLHHTQITGSVPGEFGGLKDLETFSVYATDLEGTMPRSVCRNRNTLGGQLINLQADCGGFNPEVMCICCSMCFPIRRMTLDTAAVVMQPTAMPVVPPPQGVDVEDPEHR